MKNCRDIQAELSALVDNELPPSQQVEVQAHVNNCAACQRHVGELRKLATGVAALPVLPVPAEFVDDLEKRIRAERMEAGRSTWFDWLFRPVWLKVPIEVLTVVAVVVVMTVFKSPSPERREVALLDAPRKQVMAKEIAADRSDEKKSRAIDLLAKSETENVVKNDKPVALAATPSPAAAPMPAAMKLGATSSSASGLGGRKSGVSSAIVLKGNMAEVQGRVQSLLASCRGRVVASPTGSVTRSYSPRQSIWVSLPVSAVDTFRRQLNNADGRLRSEADALKPSEEVSKIAEGQAAAADVEMTVLEIQVVAP